MVLDIVTDPDGFFEREAEEPDWIGPIVLVLLTAILGIAGSLVPTLLGAGTAAGGGFGMGFSLVTSVIGGIIAPVVRWAFYGVVLYAIPAILFDADGELADMFALSGWGFLPSVIATGIYAAANAYAYSQATIPQNPTPQEMIQFQQQILGNPVLLTATVVGIAFLFWSALIWTFAVKHGMDVTTKRAGITVAFPVTLALLVALLGLASQLFFQSVMSGLAGGAA